MEFFLGLTIFIIAFYIIAAIVLVAAVVGMIVLISLGIVYLVKKIRGKKQN